MIFWLTMEFGILKPLLTGLAMPLASLVMLALLGVVLAARRKHHRKGLLLGVTALSALWLLSCQGVAVWLAAHALPQFPPITPEMLTARKVQAIVVMGGGIYPQAPEYGRAQPGPATAARLRYGIWLARQTALPVAFTGGSGWAASRSNDSEAVVAAWVAREDYGIALRWLESESRDTRENARLLTLMLRRDGIDRIALVTDALHMPRSVLEFEHQGLAITPAPTGFVLPTRSNLLLWLPSIDGLTVSTRALHEVLGLTVAKLR